MRARVERFGEPALLLLLREAPAHGYELIERLPELLPEERGVVRSDWDADAPGPAKRIYELTDEGRALLDSWAASLRTAQENVSAFLARYEDGRR